MTGRASRPRHTKSQSDKRIWNLAKVAVCVTVAFIAVLALVVLVRMLNASSEVRRCVYVRRFSVSPTTPALPPGATHEPSAFGYLYTDTQQLFVRWRIADDYTAANVPITDILLRGPLTPTEPDVAPVLLALGTERNALTQYFVGNATAELAQLGAIQNDPSAFYVAFYTDIGGSEHEIGRDYLNKVC